MFVGKKAPAVRRERKRRDKLQELEKLLVILKASHPLGPIFRFNPAGFGPTITCVKLFVPF
jgi:hypothetical protein